MYLINDHVGLFPGKHVFVLHALGSVDARVVGAIEPRPSWDSSRYLAFPFAFCPMVIVKPSFPMVLHVRIFVGRNAT
jgi:hypothetical protein